jgi:hypothetical protein
MAALPNQSLRVQAFSKNIMKKHYFAIVLAFVVLASLGFYKVCVSGIKERCQYDVVVYVECAKDSIPVNIQGRTITVSEEVSAHITTVSSVSGSEESMIHATLHAPSIQKWSLKERDTTHSVLASRSTVMAAVRSATMIPTDVLIKMNPVSDLLP